MRARPTLDSDLLTTFLAVLRQGRISAAARALHLSQPAVTARVRRLEQAVGARLLLRSTQGVTPTPAGERLAAAARDVERRLEEVLREIGGEGRALGPLALCASTTIAAHVLPGLLARFRGRYPEVRLELEIGNTAQVLAAVEQGSAGLGLVEGAGRAAGVRLEPWVDDELVPVVGALARSAPRTPADLETTPILWREPGSGTREVVLRALRRAGLRARPKPIDLVLGSSEAIAGCASAGLGLAFLSRWALGPHLAAGLLRPVPALGLELRRTFRWALPSGARSPAAEALLRLAQPAPRPPA